MKVHTHIASCHGPLNPYSTEQLAELAHQRVGSEAGHGQRVVGRRGVESPKKRVDKCYKTCAATLRARKTLNSIDK